MKKIFYLVWLMVGLAVMPACQRANQLEQETMRQDSINAALQDSINTANAEKDSLMQLMSAAWKVLEPVRQRIQILR